MKAALLKTWTDMAVVDMEKPVPAADEAVIAVRYAGVCGSDITVYNGKHPTATAPVVVGHEILGVIEQIGDNPDFKVGDRVTVEPLIQCGVCDACRRGHHICKNLKLLGIHENGGYAEYTKTAVSKLVKIPDSLPDDVAALAEPFAVGYHVVARSEIRKGDTALVIGAGPIGIIVGLAAQYAGASRVVITDLNPERLAMAESLGLEGLHPADGDSLAEINRLTDGNGFEVVYEASASKGGMLMSTSACRIGGAIVPLSLAGVPTDFCVGVVSFKELRLIGSRVYTMEHFRAGVQMLADIAEKKDLHPLISDVLPLEDAQKAVDMMMKGENKGKILLKI